MGEVVGTLRIGACVECVKLANQKGKGVEDMDPGEEHGGAVRGKIDSGVQQRQPFEDFDSGHSVDPGIGVQWAEWHVEDAAHGFMALAGSHANLAHGKAVCVHPGFDAVGKKAGPAKVDIRAQHGKAKGFLLGGVESLLGPQSDGHASGECVGGMGLGEVFQQ